ncbi:hypothetical protein ACROYT_G038551 [Oculina patagonica]
MAVVDESWQTMRPTIKERVTFHFDNEMLSDVKFVVPSSNGESESKKVIPAHKFVLAISSPVFFAMFYGQMAETTDSIELPDCDYESLLELFRYLYSDEVRLSGSNAMQVSYLAKKYMVPSLVRKCAEYLRDNLEASNVFCILPHAQKFEDKDLEDRCWEVIEKQTEEALKSDEFVTVERSLVESVVKREVLSVTEVELFIAVDRWATKESERQGTTPDEAKRRILGEEIVKAIRFPLMSQKEFISVVPDCNILTTEEIVDIMKYYNNVLTTPLQFSAARRAKADMTIYQCRRFGDFYAPPAVVTIPYASNSQHICLTVNKAIQLLGVQLFGYAAKSYTASVEVKDTTDGSSIVRKSGSYTCISKSYRPDLCYYGFNVMFDDPVYLKPNKLYEIMSLSKGHHPWLGQKGKATVECGGVVFSFSNSDAFNTDSNGTSVTKGQFPSLLFRTG